MDMKTKIPFKTPELTVEDLSMALFQANKSLEEKNRLLIQSQKEKNDLFNNISHDLRSPITAIQNSTEYLLTLNNPDEATLKTYLELIKKRTSLLSQLIEDIFLLSSLDSSSIKLRKERIHIGMFLEEFFFLCEADSKYSTRKLILDLEDPFPNYVHIDTKLLTPVLDNLFTNALKYSTENSTITLSATREENTIQITVSDTGFGIPEDSLDKIFNRSYMVCDARTPNNNSGCGLGLSIAKSIIDLHEGEIKCKSKYGEGRTFEILLPLSTI